MRTMERPSEFNRDFKHAKEATRRGNDPDSLVSTVVARLAADKVSPNQNREHGLSGECAGYYEGT